MLKRILVAILFIFIGGIAFALLAPLLFTGDMRSIGATAFPFIAIAFGTIGFIVGGRMPFKKK